MIRAESMLPLGWDWGLLMKTGLALGGNEIKALPRPRNLHGSGLYLAWARLVFS